MGNQSLIINPYFPPVNYFSKNCFLILYFCNMKSTDYEASNMFKKVSFSYPLFPISFTANYCYLLH